MALGKKAKTYDKKKIDAEMKQIEHLVARLAGDAKHGASTLSHVAKNYANSAKDLSKARTKMLKLL